MGRRDARAVHAQLKEAPPMREEYGPTFVTITDEDGREIVLEYLDAVEYNGVIYEAFYPAETEGEGEDPDSGLIILKLIQENGEELLSTPDTEAEAEAVYDLFMEQLFEDEDDDDAGEE